LSRASITKAHQKIQELSWEPTFVEPVDQRQPNRTPKRQRNLDPSRRGDAKAKDQGPPAWKRRESEGFDGSSTWAATPRSKERHKQAPTRFRGNVTWMRARDQSFPAEALTTWKRDAETAMPR
jgi:hypothetical protein